jgi:glyoxylase-like metal-dependent hydrolase (beta-lactamase superfamily II)
MGRFITLPQDHVYAFVVELENSVIVVDSTLALSSSQELRKMAESFKKPIEAVLMTHGHPDHYSGLVSFKDLPIYASQGCFDFAKIEDIRKAPTATYLLGDDWAKERYFPNQIITDNTVLKFGGVNFIFRDLGPGESDSDGTWTFQNDRVKYVFVGDLVANLTHSFFRDGHTTEWLQILDNFEKEFDESTKFYFGHGEPATGTRLIKWQKGYINKFLKTVKNLKDRKIPASEETKQIIWDAMKDYLPLDDLFFLTTYDIDDTLEDLFKKI